MEHSFDHRTMILNSFDDQDLSVDRTETRVVSEMDFFAEKKNIDGAKDSSSEDGNQLNLGLRVCTYIYICK